ncbi:MAG: prepilin-type N-terminal cleavage/methylation domain-containing protein, partial [Planctomycetaceae bacterium]|nr:prepilin-type N-terminal cleavage/methylation domain-containing protein [Planctomycetaceae bacterium]
MAVRRTATGCRIQGFTLVEVVIVLLVLGILASIAIPRFVDLKRDALHRTLKEIKGALYS